MASGRQLRVCVCLLLIVSACHVSADAVSTPDGLVAHSDGTALSDLTLDGATLPGVSAEALVLDPRTGEPAEGFTVAAEWTADGNCLRFEGSVKAPGDEDRVADLLIRIRGVSIPLSTIAEDPLLLPAKLLSKLPIVPLRIGDSDELALAVPPDRLTIFRFEQGDGAVTLRYPLGFTRDAKPELRMQAPFSCVLYRTDPQWHFRSALKRYYELFPEPFEPFIRKAGGWFFAAPTTDLPNPQHFLYHEGGPAGWEADDERGLQTYPYRESSSATVHLNGDTLPASKAEALERFAELEDQIVPTGWEPQASSGIATEISHSGERSLLADNSAGPGWAGARQAVLFGEPVNKPIVVTGWSKTADVSGGRDNDYSIYVDVCYASGGYKFGQCATFTPGTHDWEQSTYTIEPAEPVAELRVYCILRGRTGKAWFDDIHIGPADEPQLNWMSNPGFEQDQRRSDLQHIRDNVCIDTNDEWIFRITDNVSADVPPTTPMNLLRFTLNVDPDIPDTDDRPNVAGRQFEAYDRIFRDFPSVDGAYIDSVSAWCYGVLNTRREHWPANDAPFTYDPQTFRVVVSGRFGMTDLLGALQERYHPLGKPIFTNIHVNLDAFPLYLVSDVPGIESSLFNDQDSMFFYRASSYKKPLLLLNFMNLHGLDRRDVAERYHLNAAQWGELPSTGRFVQDAYRLYGDVTHAWMPAIIELAEAGWEPIPYTSGAQAERFGAGDATYLTVRAPEEPTEQRLNVDMLPVIRTFGAAPAVMDAVRLCELPLEHGENGLSIPLTHGAGRVSIIRISSRESAQQWLWRRAGRHALNASRVEGTQSETPEIIAARDMLSQPLSPKGGDELLAQLDACRTALGAALVGLPEAGDDVFELSRRRELEQALHALTALVAIRGHLRVEAPGPRTVFPGDEIDTQFRLSHAGGLEAAVRSVSLTPGLDLVPDWIPALGDPVAATPGALRANAPGAYRLRAIVELRADGHGPWLLEHSEEVYARPPVTLRLQTATDAADERVYTVAVERGPRIEQLVLEARLAPDGATQPSRAELAVDLTQGVFRVPRMVDGAQRTLTVVATDGAGTEYARAETTFWDEPPLPTGDVALASAGAKVTADSSYSGYSPETVIDGVKDTAGLHWTKAAWASTDSGGPHWVQIGFPEARSIGQVVIYWSLDASRLHTSRAYVVTALTDAGAVELARVSGQEPSSASIHRFDAISANRVRIEQAARGGPGHRPGIMWIREVCVAP